MKVKKYISYLNEALNLEELSNELSDNYIDLKNDILDMINTTLEESDVDNIDRNNLKDFIDDYLSDGKDAGMINELIEDNDIFNFYLKHQSDIDELLNDTGYMDKSPNQNDVFSLYDVIIDGTKQSILDILRIIETEIFTN